MKKYVFGLVGFLGMAGALSAQSVTLNIDAGYLEDTGGSAVSGYEPVGGLLQLIASPSGTFSGPTASSFAGNGEILVASFAMDYANGPETANTLSSLPLTNVTYLYGVSSTDYSTGVYTLAAGNAVELRFYPGLTYSNTTNYDTTSPSSATTALTLSYGQVRSSTVEFGGTDDPTETAWVLPSSGGNVDLDYLTTVDNSSAPVTYTELSAEANGVLALVPEPSAFAMLAAGFAGLIGVRLWNRPKASPSMT